MHAYVYYNYHTKCLLVKPDLFTLLCAESVDPDSLIKQPHFYVLTVLTQTLL